MKLQKMLYFLYRDYLKNTGRPLFAERFMTWKYGPVLASIYQEYRKYGGQPIKDYGASPGGVFVIKEEADADFAAAVEELWVKCKNIDAFRLSQITHGQGGAWEQARKNKNLFLSDEDIKKDSVNIPYV